MARKLCVFCGINAPQPYIELGKSFGKKMVDSSWDLVYGGASIGLMGVIADSVLQNGGNVYGVIPKKLVDIEVAHNNLTQLFIVKSLYNRKVKMFDLSDAFVTLPGGLGTLDELCEALTLSKLKYHKKPIFLLNYQGFFDSLMDHFRHIKNEGFLDNTNFLLIHEVTSVEELFLKISQL